MEDILTEAHFIPTYNKYVFHNDKWKVKYKSPRSNWDDYDLFISENNIKFIVTQEYSKAYVNMMTQIPKIIVLTETGCSDINLGTEGEYIYLYY